MPTAIAIANTSAIGLPPPGKMSAGVNKAGRSCALSRQGRMNSQAVSIQIV